MKQISIKTLKNFTTEPKIRRFLKRGAFISVNRCLDFMFHLWGLKLKKCSYETLEFEFVQFFGSNDKRTIERYLGRLEKTERHTGCTEVIRMNRLSGKMAQFEYFNERRLPAKKGLLEILGYISRVKEGNETRYLIHHERMPYYTVQTKLEKERQETADISQEKEESSEVSKEEMRVCSLYEEVSVGETSVSPRTERLTEITDIEATEKKEEEVIDGTHTNQLSESENVIISLQKCKTLTPEEQAILTTKPTPKKCVDCGRIDVSNPYRVWCPRGKGERSRFDVCAFEGESER